jgi:hypothetical protein
VPLPARIWIACLVAFSLNVSCRQASPTAPGSSVDPWYLPRPFIPVSVDLGGSTAAQEARRVVVTELNRARLVVEPMGSNIELFIRPGWIALDASCRILEIPSPDCAMELHGCVAGDAINWSCFTEGPCGPGSGAANNVTKGPETFLWIEGTSAASGASGSFRCYSRMGGATRSATSWAPAGDATSWSFYRNGVAPENRQATLAVRGQPGGSQMEFIFADTLRWEGAVLRGGREGRMALFSRAGDGWTIRHEVSWSDGSGRWACHTGASGPLVRSW